MQNIFVTIGAIAFVVAGLSGETSQSELLARGALGGGIGAVLAGFLGFSGGSASAKTGGDSNRAARVPEPSDE